MIMKKKNLKTLKLNKKAVSNLQSKKGGGDWTWFNCDTDRVCPDLTVPKTKCQDAMCITYSCLPGCSYFVC